MKIILIALALLATQASFASQCIYTSQIRSYNAVDTMTIEIDAGKKDYVMSVGYCSELSWSHSIAFETYGSPKVCPGDRLLIVDTFSNQLIQSCRIQNINQIK